MNVSTKEVAVFAGGCFWCTEAVFKRISGVEEVIPGYTGGHIKNPAYREVCMGVTGHAEAVKILYAPNIVSYTNLLELFFATHDPTTLNRQGNDVGTQYRSGIFYSNDNQKTAAENYIKVLNNKKIYPKEIITEIVPLGVFYEAEQHHKDYYDLYSSQPYCQVVIRPKLKKLEQHYSHQLKTDL